MFGAMKMVRLSILFIISSNREYCIKYFLLWNFLMAIGILLYYEKVLGIYKYSRSWRGNELTKGARLTLKVYILKAMKHGICLKAIKNIFFK